MSTSLRLFALAFITTGNVSAQSFINEEVISEPTRDRFSVCYDHGCNTVVRTSLSKGQWESLTSPLADQAKNPQEERAAIAEAIAIMEHIVGNQTGTHADKGGNMKGFGQPGQMDCVDESTNTHTYLTLLEKSGLMKWHRLSKRSTRLGLFAGMPHSTAVLEENGSGIRYAVDSWFHDNGEPPAIIELTEWKSGWRPAPAR